MWPVGDEALVRLIEDVRNTRADIVEQADRISKEVCRADHNMQLAQRFLHVVALDAADECIDRNTSIFQYQSIVANWCIVDIADGHREHIHSEHERIS